MKASKSTRISTATIVGLTLSLVGYAIVSVALDLPLFHEALPENTLTLMKLSLVWIVAGVVIAIVLFGEGRSLKSIGIQSITTREVLAAIGLGVLLSFSVPILTLIVNRIIPSTSEGSVAAVATNVPAGILLFATLTAGLTEEILYRGYAIERLTELTGKQWVAIVVSVTAFVLPHIAAWNWTHILAVVIPLGIVLSLLYVWKRNLILNMIVHILIDLPLVFIALFSGQG